MTSGDGFSEPIIVPTSVPEEMKCGKSRNQLYKAHLQTILRKWARNKIEMDCEKAGEKIKYVVPNKGN